MPWLLSRQRMSKPGLAALPPVCIQINSLSVGLKCDCAELIGSEYVRICRLEPLDNIRVRMTVAVISTRGHDCEGRPESFEKSGCGRRAASMMCNFEEID